jgi:hypothetical protein
MSADTSAPARQGPLWPVAAAALLLLLALRLHLMLRLNIHWDEFHYLSFVYDFLRDAPLTWRQTFHVHAFSWLASVAGGEVSQIVAARLVLFGLGLATCSLIYFIGRRFLSPTGALFAVLCYSALSEVIVHGASFRPDPLATFLVTAAAALLLARPASTVWAAVAGLVLAISFMCTFKTVFFLPGLGILVLTTATATPPWRRRLLGLAVLATSVLVWVLLLSALHRYALVPSVTDANQVAGARRLAGGLLWTGYWFPGRFYLLRSFGQSPLVWLLLAGGLAQALLGLRSPAERGKLIVPLLALALPLATLVVYRNSFPYFLPDILAPAILLCGLGLDRLRRWADRSGRLGPVLSLALVLGVAATGVTNYLRQVPNTLAEQRLLVSTIHRMFPEPVPYIDRCSMIASFPKVGFFMSTWGMDSYTRQQQAVLTDAVETHAPPFLVANTLPLNLLLPDHEAARLRYRLLAEDRLTLQQNYIHHWGVVFVAGKHLEVASGETQLTILIPGSYTLEGVLQVRIDGRRVRPGDVIDLAAGPHTVAADTAGRLTLRWGDHLYLPDEPAPRSPVFIGL